MTPADPLLVLDAVSVTYRGARAAAPRDVTFDVARGEVVVLLGPSGCGKSTLALTVNGLVPHAIDAERSGRVVLAGADVAELRVADAATRAAMVFQDADAQLVADTVFDEVAFGPENLALPVPEVERRTRAALDRVGLGDRAADRPEHLSGGERQRLALAAALALGSPLLVLDEPTANLDPASTRRVYDVLAELVETGEVGIVLVEHDLDEALRIATRIVALDADGRLVADGPPRRVLEERADDLDALGVWLPVATRAARRLRAIGWDAPAAPLTCRELADAVADETGPAVGNAPVDATDERPTAPIVAVRDLRIRRGRRTVLDIASLDLVRGAITVVIGPNGAGKSTLLEAVSGVEAPPRRTVTMTGDDVARLPVRELRRRVGFVFQNPEHQFLAPTVREELELEARTRGVDAAAADVDGVLSRFGLTAHADRHPFLLSGGQKRRLSVGTALVGGAELLVLDEPTFGQDRARADELLALLHELRAAGTTIVLATHDLQLVADHADRVVVLDRGSLVADGAVDEILASDALERAGLGLPPLAAAFRALPAGHALHGVVRLGSAEADA